MSLSHGDWPHPWPLNDTKSEINYSDAGHKAPQHKSSLSSTYQCLQYFKLTCYQCLRLEIWDRRRISTQQWKVHRYSEWTCITKMNELYGAFLTEFQKKKPKYTVANQNKDTQYNMPMRKLNANWTLFTSMRLEETPTIKSRLDLALHLTDWGDGASLLDQSVVAK